MPDMIIHNETGYDLAAWILDSIKADAIEYFGEAIDSIRVQTGSGYRHRFNVKTREVLYAFFPEDYALENSITSSDADAVSLADRVSLSIPDVSILGPIDLVEEENDDDEVAVLVVDFDLLEDVPVGEFEGVDPDLDVMDDSGTVMIGDDHDEFD